jgi:hypothetical protein
MATMGLWEHWSILWHCWEFSGAYVDIPPVCEYRFFSGDLPYGVFVLRLLRLSYVHMSGSSNGSCFNHACERSNFAMHLTSQCIVLLLRASLWDWRIVSPPKQMEAVTHERTGDEHVAASQTNWKHWHCAQLSSLTYSIGRIAKRLPTVLSSSLFFLSSFSCAPGIK